MHAILFFVSVVVLIGIMRVLSRASRKASRKASREAFDNTCGESVECQDGKNKHVVKRRYQYRINTHAACCDPGSYINTPTATSSTCETCPDADGVASEHYDKLTDNSVGMINNDDSPTIVLQKDTVRSCKTRCKVGMLNEGVWDERRGMYIMADGRQFMCKKYYTLEQVTDEVGVNLSSLQTYTWDQTAMAHDLCPSGQTTVPDGAEPDEGDFCCDNLSSPSNLRISTGENSEDTVRCCLNSQINVDGVCTSCPTIQKNALLNTTTDINPVGMREYTTRTEACVLSTNDEGACSKAGTHASKWRNSTLITDPDFTRYTQGCDVTVDKAALSNANVFDQALSVVKYDEQAINAFATDVDDQLSTTLFDEFSSSHSFFQPDNNYNNRVAAADSLASNAKMTYAPGELENEGAFVLTARNTISNLYACANTDAGVQQFVRRASDSTRTDEYGCCPSGQYLSGVSALISCATPPLGFEIPDGATIYSRMTSACPTGFGVSNDACWPCAEIDANPSVKQHGKWYSDSVGTGTEACTKIANTTQFSLNGDSVDIRIEDILENTILGVSSGTAVVVGNNQGGLSLNRMTNNDYNLIPRTADGELYNFGQGESTVYLNAFSALKLATVSGDTSTKYLVHVVNSADTSEPVLRFLKNRLQSIPTSIESLYFSAEDEYADSDGNDRRMVVTQFDRSNASPPALTAVSAVAYNFNIGSGGIYEAVDLNEDYRKYLVMPTYSPDYVTTCTPDSTLNQNQNRTLYYTTDNSGVCESCETGYNVSANYNYQCTLQNDLTNDCSTSASNDVYAVQGTDGTWTCLSVGENMAYDVTDPSTLIDCTLQGKQRLVSGNGRIMTNPLDLECDNCPEGQILENGACVACEVNTKQVGNTCEACPIWEYTTGAGSTTCESCDVLKYRITGTTGTTGTTCDGTLAYNEYFDRNGALLPSTCTEYTRRDDRYAALVDPPYTSYSGTDICSGCGSSQYLDPTTGTCENFTAPTDDGKKRDNTATNGWSWCPVNQVRNPSAPNSCIAISDNDKYRTSNGAPTVLPLHEQRDSTNGATECDQNHIRRSGMSSCSTCYSQNHETPVRTTGDPFCSSVPDGHAFAGGISSPSPCTGANVPMPPTVGYSGGVLTCQPCPNGTYKDTNTGECEPLIHNYHERGDDDIGFRVCTDLTKYRDTTRNENKCDTRCPAGQARQSSTSSECVTIPEGQHAHGQWCRTNQMRDDDNPNNACRSCPAERPRRPRQSDSCTVLSFGEHMKLDSTNPTGESACPSHQYRDRADSNACIWCPYDKPQRAGASAFCVPGTINAGLKLNADGTTWGSCPPHKVRSPINPQYCSNCPEGHHRPGGEACERYRGANNYYPPDASGNPRESAEVCPPHSERTIGSDIKTCSNCAITQYSDREGSCQGLSSGYGRVGPPDNYGQVFCGGKTRSDDGYCPQCRDGDYYYNRECMSPIQIERAFKTNNSGEPFAKGYYLTAASGTIITDDQLRNPRSHPGMFAELAVDMQRSNDDISSSASTSCGTSSYRNSGDSDCTPCGTNQEVVVNGNTKSCIQCPKGRVRPDNETVCIDQVSYTPTDRDWYIDHKAAVSFLNGFDLADYNNSNTVPHSGSFYGYEYGEEPTLSECALECERKNILNNQGDKQSSCTYFRLDSNGYCWLSAVFDDRDKGTPTTEGGLYGYRLNDISNYLPDSLRDGQNQFPENYACHKDTDCQSGTCANISRRIGTCTAA